MSDCPSCQRPLEVAQLDELAFRLCKACRGMLLSHPDLTRVLEDSWRAIPKKKAEETQFFAREQWQKESARFCPDCRKPLEKYGYMGLAAVQIDRCDGCEVVWLDADELQNMVLALAKTNYRCNEALRREQSERIDLTQGIVPPMSATKRFPLFDKPGAGEVTVAALQILRLFVR